MITCSASAIGISIVHWIHLYYPARPKQADNYNQPKKSIKPNWLYTLFIALFFYNSITFFFCTS